MRGEGSIEFSDFDYICFFKEINKEIINTLINIKNESPKNNFLYLDDNEYKKYPKDSRLQFFITRKIYGNYNLGEIPNKEEVFATATKYAITLKDTIRPL